MRHVICPPKGYVFEVMDFIYERVEKRGSIDGKLVRTFIANLLKILKPPYSKEFANSFCKLILQYNMTNFLQNLNAVSKGFLKDFVQECASNPELLSKADSFSISKWSKEFFG